MTTGKRVVREMVSRDLLIRSFEEIIGWPYESPGSNDQNGIDCSGAFVRAYRAQGASIYHGSNRIIRAHCRDVFRVDGVSQLMPGMAVFKAGAWSALGKTKYPEYQPGGRYFNAALNFDFYHIGLVVSVSPLRIIHATTPVAKVDTTLGTWSWAGYLKDVNYTEGGGEIMPDVGTTMEVYAANGLPVRMRQMPSTTSATLHKIEVGEAVLAKGQQGAWTQITYKGTAGWMQSQFLRAISFATIPDPGDGDTVRVPRALLADMRDKLAALLGVG